MTTIFAILVFLSGCNNNALTMVRIPVHFENQPKVAKGNLIRADKIVSTFECGTPGNPSCDKWFITIRLAGRWKFHVEADGSRRVPVIFDVDDNGDCGPRWRKDAVLTVR